MSTKNIYYNMLTDSGLWNGSGSKPTQVTVTASIWNTALDACVDDGTFKFKKIMYFEGGVTYLFAAINNQLRTNLRIEGDGNSSVLGFDGTISGGNNTPAAPGNEQNLLVSYGHSSFSIKDCAFTGNAKHLDAIIKVNSFGANNATICRNIKFCDLQFDSVWADCLKFAETSAGDSHRIDGLTIKDISFNKIGNPGAPYNIGEVARNLYCYCINLNQTCDGVTIDNIKAKNISGVVIEAYGDGQTSTVFAPRQTNGDWSISNVSGESMNMLIEIFGNHFRHGIRISNCYAINPTGAFAYSLSGDRIYASGINAIGYEGRSLYELRGTNCFFSGVGVCYTCARPAADKTNEIGGFSTGLAAKQTSGSNLILTTAFQNKYEMLVRYDQSQGISTNAPNRRSGIHIVGQDSPSTQPTSWDGRSNYFAFNFGNSEIRNYTGPGIYAEVVRVDDIVLPASCVFASPYSAEDVVRISGKRWKIFCQIDGSGSASTSAGAVSVNTSFAGADYNSSIVQPLITNWNNATKLKNTNLYTYKAYVTLPQAEVSSI